MDVNYIYYLNSLWQVRSNKEKWRGNELKHEDLTSGVQYDIDNKNLRYGAYRNVKHISRRKKYFSFKLYVIFH